MRRTLVVVPDWLRPGQSETPLRQNLPTLRALAELGRLVRLSGLPRTDTPEALWLGLRPGEGELAQGPLTVAALGADPPPRSTHFHVSLLGVVDGTVVKPPSQVPPEELSAALEAARRLNTKSLTFLGGEHLDHALVWEGIGDLATVAADQVAGQPMRPHLPQGDAEAALRRFIDDSVNLLGELELNERRLDEGLAPLNLLWPWGHGRRKPVPNLALRRGEPATVESASLRLAGLSRLVGYRHGDRSEFGKGMGTRLEALARRCLERDLSIVVLEAPSELMKDGKEEEAHWFARQLDERLLEPLLDQAIRSPGRVALLAPGADGGLAVVFDHGDRNEGVFPFDERSLEERSLPQTDLWSAVENAAARPLSQAAEAPPPAFCQ